MGVLEVLHTFAELTSIHGLGFLVKPLASLRFRITWALLFTAGMLYASLQLRVDIICKLTLLLPPKG